METYALMIAASFRLLPSLLAVLTAAAAHDDAVDNPQTAE